MLVFICILYILLAVLSVVFLEHLSVVFVVGLLYLLPLIINFFATNNMLKNPTQQTLRIVGILPALSLLFYSIFGFIAEYSGKWHQFVLQNTIQSDHFTVEVNDRLLDPAQLIFVTVLYVSLFGLNYFYQLNKLKTLKEV